MILVEKIIQLVAGPIDLSGIDLIEMEPPPRGM